MRECIVRAMFLMAGIEIQRLQQIRNAYWPEHQDYDKYRDKSPWWLVQTSRGFIEIGWRKRVIYIDWRDTGIVFPFIDQEGREISSDEHISAENTTKWETGIHAWSYGKAVDYLSHLWYKTGRHDYLKDFWANNPEGEVKNWAIRADSASWAITAPERINVIIKARSRTEALQIFYEKNSCYCHSTCSELEKLNEELEKYNLPLFEADT